MADPIALASLLGCQPVSAYSHIAAAGIALAAALPLIRSGRGCNHRVAALTVYTICVVLTMGISGAYHSFDRGELARRILQRLDYFAIFCLIAGTFTAVHGVVWRGGFWRNGVVALMWGCALVGITLQALWWNVFSGDGSLVLYLGMSSVGVVSIVKLWRTFGFRRVLPLLGPGLVYAIGAVLEARGWPTLVNGWVEAHEVFHGAVLIGVGGHWLFIRRLVTHHAAVTPATVATTTIAPAFEAAA